MHSIRMGLLSALVLMNLSVGCALGQEQAPGTLRVAIPNHLLGQGVLNVRDFGAVGDGVTDDTAAIQKALSQGLDNHRIVYLPDGTYLVSDTLKWWRAGYNLEAVNGWGAFLQMQGQSRAGTVIRLKDRAAGFQDASKPKAVVATGSRGYHGRKGYKQGEGNEAFFNNIRHLTVDVGVNNPGAIGIDYQVSNAGGLRDVTVRSSDPRGAGAVGIYQGRRDNGPGVVADVLVQGFARGLEVRGFVAQMILEDVTLQNQSESALVVHDAIVAVNRLRTLGAVPGVRQTGASLVTLVNSQLQGKNVTDSTPALELSSDDGALVLHKVRTPGYAVSVLNRRTAIRGELGEWWVSDAMKSMERGQTPAEPVNLPVADPPHVALGDASQWVSVGAPNGTDDTAAIAAALNRGAAVVYFEPGRYRVSQTLIVPPSVKLISGFGGEIAAVNRLRQDGAVFQCTGGQATDITWIDRMCVSLGKAAAIEHNDARTLVLRDLMCFGGNGYRGGAGAGKLFVDDVAMGGYVFSPGQQFWARNLDDETELITARNAKLWVLGYKREGVKTMFDLRESSQAVLLGGFVYCFGGKNKQPLIRLSQSSASVSFAGATFVADGFFDEVVRMEEKIFPAGWGFNRVNAVMLPLLNATPNIPAK